MYTLDGNRLIIVFLFRTRPGLFWGEIKKRSRNLSVGEAIDRAGFPSERISRRKRELLLNRQNQKRMERYWRASELYALAECTYLSGIKAGKLTGLSDLYELTNLFTHIRVAEMVLFLTELLLFQILIVIIS